MIEPGNESGNSSYDAAYAEHVQMDVSAITNNGGVGGNATAPLSQQKKQGRGWIVAIVVVAIICATILLSVVSCNSVTSDALKTFSMGSTSTSDSISSPSIGVIEIGGTIQYDGTTCSPEGLKAQLDRAEREPNILGVILHVNSGGGVATAGEEMAGYVREFSKPIVVSTAATNASAAYEISSQADYIFADKTSMVGSIGVFMQLTDLSGLYDMLGIKVDTIKSAESKDAGGGTRALTDEEREWYQHMVDQINEDFIQTVASGRNMDIDEVRELANGLPYTGMDGVEVGLVDEIGNLDSAISYLSDQLGHSEPLRTYALTSSKSDLSTLLDLLGESDQSISADDLKKLLENAEGGLYANN